MERVCIEYLCELKLPYEQTGQLVNLFDKLGLTAAIEQLVVPYFQQTWTRDVMATLCVILKRLLPDHFSLCQRLLNTDSRGALCEVQVRDHSVRCTLML